MKMDDFIKYYHQGITDRGGCGGPVMGYMVALAIVLMLCGCKTIKSSINENIDTRDSVRVDYIEKIVEVPVTVTVEVPQQKTERETKDSVSHLETSFAKSTAAIHWNDGIPFLFHNLENIPQKITKTDSVPVKEKTKVEWRTRRVTYTKTEIREKPLTWWQKAKLDFSEWVLGVLILIIIVFVFKHKVSKC